MKHLNSLLLVLVLSALPCPAADTNTVKAPAKTNAPEPVYPDNFAPGLMADSVFATDTYVGYSGGDIAPMIPGSRFKIFDNY